jgi:predicted dinucleotide-binding enzyme
MKIGIIGAGRIGGNIARWFARDGHEVRISFSRDPARLEAFAGEIGATAGSPREAAEGADVVVVSVPWSLIDEALAAAGPLDGKIVIDTTNQFARGGWQEMPEGKTAAQVNQERMPGARLVKAFNTLTSGFQAESAGRTGPDRVVIFMCGDDADAKATVAGLIEAAGFDAVDVGGLADATPMEAPRRPGAVYGEEYHLDEARRFLAGLRG